MNDIEKNESRFCSCSPTLDGDDCLGCLADKIGVHKEIIGSIVELLEKLIDDKESSEAKSQPVVRGRGFGAFGAYRAQKSKMLFSDFAKLAQNG